jgi:hypothetical protein
MEPKLNVIDEKDGKTNSKRKIFSLLYFLLPNKQNVC